MPKLIVVTRQGKEVEVDGEAGLSIMEVIRDSGAEDIQAACGGCCACATCHVYVDDADAVRLPPISEDEIALLSTSDHTTENSRLSCQLAFNSDLEGIRVVVAPED